MKNTTTEGKNEKGDANMTTTDSDRPSDFIRDAIKENTWGQTSTAGECIPGFHRSRTANCTSDAKAICISICARAVG